MLADDRAAIAAYNALQEKPLVLPRANKKDEVRDLALSLKAAMYLHPRRPRPKILLGDRFFEMSQFRNSSTFNF